MPNTRRKSDFPNPEPSKAANKRRPGRPPLNKTLKVKVESSDESDTTRKTTSVSLPVPVPADPVEVVSIQPVARRRPGRPSRKAEVESSDESDTAKKINSVSLPVPVPDPADRTDPVAVVSIKPVTRRRPGRPSRKAEVESSDESDTAKKTTSVSLLVPVPDPADAVGVASIQPVARRRPGRPARNNTGKAESSANESKLTEKEASVLVDESDEEESVPTKRKTRSGQKQNNLPAEQPMAIPQVPKKRGRPVVKKEPIDESLVDLEQAASSSCRQTRRSANSYADTSSVDSNSPSREASGRPKRARAGQVT